MLTTILCVVSMIGMGSCSDDEEVQKDSFNKAVSYSFELEYTKIDGTDNANISNATILYVDCQNKQVNKNIPLKSSSITYKSQSYTKLPGDLEVTVNECLIPDVDLNKDFYNIGMGLKFTLMTFDKDGDIVDFKVVENLSTMAIEKANLSKLFPITSSFNYHIDANGRIQAK